MPERSSSNNTAILMRNRKAGFVRVRITVLATIPWAAERADRFMAA
jgi:hypothetical protein